MHSVKVRFQGARAALFAGRYAVSLSAFLLAHVGHGATLKQDMPRPIMRVASRYEHIIMRAINFLSMCDWIYKNPTLRRRVEWLSGKVMSVANGEVLSLQEAKEMVASIIDSGYTVAVVTCPCRRARNVISDDVPNNSDMVFGQWADTYLETYPGLYHRVGLDEAVSLLDEFDRCGFLHQVHGFNGKQGAAYVLCNCDQSVCIPLLAQKSRGFQAFKKGRSEAVIDEGACLGVEECGACIARCPFDARKASASGKASVVEGGCFGCGVCVVTCKGDATRLRRKEGAQLVYARDFVS
jgi:ferredoxin